MDPYCTLQLGGASAKTKKAYGDYQSPNSAQSKSTGENFTGLSQGAVACLYYYTLLSGGGRNPNWRECLRLEMQPGCNELSVTVGVSSLCQQRLWALFRLLKGALAQSTHQRSLRTDLAGHSCRLGSDIILGWHQLSNACFTTGSGPACVRCGTLARSARMRR